MNALQNLGDPAGHSSAEYWDKFFTTVTNSTAFEWYCDLVDFISVFHSITAPLHLPISSLFLLHGGTGNSDLIFELFTQHNVSKSIAIDISSVAIEEMKQKSSQFSSENPKFLGEFLQADVLQPLLNIHQTNSLFDGYVDKGLFDAMMSKFDEECKEKTSALFTSAASVLKPTTGFYLAISLAEEHVVRLLVDYLQNDSGESWKSLDVFELDPFFTSGKKGKLRPFCFVVHRGVGGEEGVTFNFNNFINGQYATTKGEFSFESVNNAVNDSRDSYAEAGYNNSNNNSNNNNINNNKDTNNSTNTPDASMCCATLHIKPFEPGFNWEQFATKLKSEYFTEEDGLTSNYEFKDYEIVPVGYGVCKLVITIVTSFEDLDLVVELIGDKEDDDISSVDVEDVRQLVSDLKFKT